MLQIRIDGELLTFNQYEKEWEGEGEVLASVINRMLPDEIGRPLLTFSELGNESLL